jgi:hypothetical protein
VCGGVTRVFVCVCLRVCEDHLLPSSLVLPKTQLPDHPVIVRLMNVCVLYLCQGSHFLIICPERARCDGGKAENPLVDVSPDFAH